MYNGENYKNGFTMFDNKTSVSDYMNLILTHECNKKCAFCVDEYVGEKGFVSIETVKKSLYFAKQKGIRDILLIGGEPTLHPEIIGIAKLVKSMGFHSIITTNYTKPCVVKKLDGIIDCINISYYSQRTLPKQSDFLSDITYSVLIHRKQINTKEKLDEFIDKHAMNANLKFSTLTDCNDWTKKMQHVSYLDSLPVSKIVLFDEIEALIYRGAIIKRYDRVVNENAEQSYKSHVNGNINRSWVRNNIEIIAC